MTTPADGIEVKLGADTGAATAGVTDASSTIQAQLNALKSALSAFTAKSADTNSAIASHTKAISNSFAGFTESVRVRLGSLNSSFLQLRSSLLAFGEGFAAFLVIRDSTRAMTELEDSVRTLEITLGTSAEKSTQLAIALKLAGSNAESFAAMAFRVQMRLNTQGAEFDRLGVKVKDASGNFLPMEDILQNIYTRMQDFKAGADQNGFALEMVGRQARDFANEMSRLGAVQQRAIELQQQLGIEMGPQRQAQVEGYRIELNAFKVTLDAVLERIGEAVLPALMQLADYFNNVGPSAIEAIVMAVKGLLTVFDLLKSVGVSVITALAAGFYNLLSVLKGVGEAMFAGITGQWSRIPGIVSNTYGEMKAQTTAAASAVYGTWADSVSRIKKLWSDAITPPRTTAPLPRSGSERFTPKPTGGGEGDIPALENELKAEQDAYNKRMLQQGSFETWSIAQTRDYWEEVLSLTGLSEKDRLAAENKYYDAERAVQIEAFHAYIANLDAQIEAQGHNIAAKIALAQKEYDAEAQRYGATSAQAAEAYKKIERLRQQLADQVVKIAELQAKREEEIASHAYAMANQLAGQMLALRQIGVQQELAMESAAEDQLYAQKHAALEKERADAEGNIERQKEIDNQLLKVEQDYQSKKTEIANKAELDRKQYALQAAQQVQDAFATFLSDITSRTKSFSQAFKDMLNSINTALVKLASQQIAKQLLGPGTQGGGFLNNLFGKIFGGGITGGGADASGAAALTTAGTTLTTSGTVLRSAGSLLTSAAAALRASAASIAAGGGLGGGFGLGGGGGGFMDILGGLGGIGGFPMFDAGTPYVPRDMLAIVHRGEAVIPASMNKGGKAASAGMVVHNHFTIAGSVDERSQGQIAAAAARGLGVAQRRHT